MLNNIEVIQKQIFDSCHNAVYEKTKFPYTPYITKLIDSNGAKVADSIPALIEMFHLISKETKHISIVEKINFKSNEYSEGIYLTEGKINNGVQSFNGMAVVNIPTGSFRSIVIDSGGGIASSQHTLGLFKEIKGLYIVPFYFDGIYVHPNCYTFFYIENDLERVMPLEAYDFNKKDDMGLNWIEEAATFANNSLGFQIKVPETENFIEKI